MKLRSNYRLGDISVSLDDVENLGTFMEIEALAEEKDFELQEKRVLELLEKLGFSEGDIIKDSYLELIMANEIQEVSQQSG